MVSKEILLEMLRRALDAEEKAVPIYTKHLHSAVSWVPLGKEKTSEVRAVFTRLGNDSAGHKKIVEDLIKQIEGDPRDAF